MIDKAIRWLTGKSAPISRWEEIVLRAIMGAPMLVLAYYLGHVGWPI